MTLAPFLYMRLFLLRALPLLLSIICLATAQAQHDNVADAVAALERGDAASAEQILRTELQARPKDDVVLGLLAVVLDQEKKYGEADDLYRRALSLAPHSAALLNNYGNHLLATGAVTDARAVFLKVLASDPRHVNANLQLARIALQRKMPAESLKYLQALPPEVIAKDPRLNLAMGVALAGTGKYDRAEQFLSRAVDSGPNDFEALYDLGLAASHAGHNERAREVLEKALKQQPENVDVMYDLAAVDVQLHRNEAALELLARAARIAPERTDILFLLAHTSADLGYFGDAAQAWERYIKLRPDDDAARREHAFAETALGEDMQSGLADLKWYVEKHPSDAVGRYELGTAESPSNREQALKELNRALALKPDLTAAHVARGLLYYRQGKPELALQDFEFAVKRDPSPGILDRTGQIYMSLERAGDALPVLRKAADLAPRDSTILFHYARALSKAGRKEEASAVFARCRELGPATSALPHPAGLVDFLSLSPEEQRARYRAGVERTVQKDPSNAEAQVRYLELLLEDGKIGDSINTAQKIGALDASPALIEEAARALLAAQQYAAAKEIIEHAAPANPSPELRVDLAIADAQVVNAQAGLDEMNKVPQVERDGNYYLALTILLDAAGRASDSAASLQQARQLHPMRPDLYQQATALLIRGHRTNEARQLLDEAMRTLPDNADFSIMKDALERSLR